jgi:hypothetical protein
LGGFLRVQVFQLVDVLLEMLHDGHQVLFSVEDPARVQCWFLRRLPYFGRAHFLGTAFFFLALKRVQSRHGEFVVWLAFNLIEKSWLLRGSFLVVDFGALARL